MPRKTKPLKYSIEEFKHAVQESTSIAMTLKKLGLSYTGQAYRTFYRVSKTHNIDFTHFTGQASNAGKIFGFKRPIEEYLSNRSPIGSYRLKHRLWEENLLQKQCCICNITTWNQQEAPLQLDHIDGDSTNNSLLNLRILCANCHAQTETHGGRNKIKARWA